MKKMPKLRRRAYNLLLCLLAVAVAVAAVVYTAMLFVTKSIRRDELENFNAGRKLLRLIDKIGHRK